MTDREKLIVEIEKLLATATWQDLKCVFLYLVE
jgi:hypothetical protein